jgi:hypothetical protein
MVRDKIVDELVKQYKDAVNSENPFHYIGTMAHAVSDSYSESHVIRGANGIEQFQDYRAQDPSKHGVADSVATSQLTGDKRYQSQSLLEQPGIKNSIEISTALIVMYKQGATADQVRDYLVATAFKLDTQFAARVSGGSAAGYAAPGARVIHPGRP